MKRFITVAIFVTLTVLLCVSAHARDSTKHRTGAQGTGFYIGGNAGLNILDDSTLINAAPLGINYDSGFLVGGTLGYDFGMLRLDAEIAYRTNDSSEILFPFPPPVSAEGSTSALSYMINGYFDIPTNIFLKPYLGAGIGYTTVSLDTRIPSFPPPFNIIVDDSDSVLSYQFSAGLGFEVSRTTTLSLGYRYFATEDPEMINSGGLPFTTEYQSHEFNVGVRFLFN